MPGATYRPFVLCGWTGSRIQCPPWTPWPCALTVACLGALSPPWRKTFQCYAVDCYEEYADLSDEEYRAALEAKREEITAFILEQCRTKRTNLYITAPVALHFAEHFEICRLCDRERHNAVGNRFMTELIDQLLQEGRLVSAETTHGAGIRTATARELKDYRKPVEQVAGQITMI